MPARTLIRTPVAFTQTALNLLALRRQRAREAQMNFETISLLLSWMELGALLAILFRLSSTFHPIANTQRELRRAIHHLGERRVAELDFHNAFDPAGSSFVSRFRQSATTQSIMDVDDLA